MDKIALCQLCYFILLLTISPTISSPSEQDYSKIDSTLTIPGKDCQYMEPTFRTQLTYTFLKEKCENTDKKKILILKSTFSGIETKLFEELPRFESLEAKNLNFTKISLSSSNLEMIDFSYNQLQSFILIVNRSLERLFLSHNKLSDVEISVLEKLNFKTLDLSYNKFLTLDSISNLASLESLNLKNNELKYIGENNLAKLKNLKVLNLSFNKLTEIHACAFCSSKKLKYLDLSLNNLKHLEGLLDPLKNLKYLNLGGNEIVNFEYTVLLSKHPNLEKIIMNCEFASNEELKYKCSNFPNHTITCCIFDRRKIQKRSVENSHFHVAINNKKMFHNVTSISKKNDTEIPSIPTKDFFEKLHNLNVDNVRNFLNVTFAKVDSSVATLDYKYGKIMEKLDLISSQLNSKLHGINETLNDVVLEMSNINGDSDDILNATLNEIVPKTSLLVSDYEELELLLSLCVFLLLILVCLTIFRTVMMIRKNRRMKRYRMNLLNLETVP